VQQQQIADVRFGSLAAPYHRTSSKAAIEC